MSSSDNSGHFEEGVIYFTTRKIKGRYVAERLELKGDDLVRTQLSRPSGRVEAMRQFKLAVGKYWRDQQISDATAGRHKRVLQRIS